MANTFPTEFFLITVPTGLNTESSVDLLERAFSKCLKKSQDDILLELTNLATLERSHTNLITKWVRNLKSLQGSLVIIGVNESNFTLLKTARLTSLCHVYTDKEKFIEAHPNVLISPSEIEHTESSFTSPSIKKLEPVPPSTIPSAPEEDIEEILDTDIEITPPEELISTKPLAYEKETFPDDDVTDYISGVADAIDSILDGEGFEDDEVFEGSTIFTKDEEITGDEDVAASKEVTKDEVITDNETDSSHENETSFFDSITHESTFNKNFTENLDDVEDLLQAPPSYHSNRSKGSITTSIDVRKLEAMAAAENVSDKLDFLNADSDTHNTSKNEDVETIQENESLFTDDLDSPITETTSDRVDISEPEDIEILGNLEIQAEDPETSSESDENNNIEFYNFKNSDAETVYDLDTEFLENLNDVDVEDSLVEGSSEEVDLEIADDTTEIFEENPVINETVESNTFLQIKSHEEPIEFQEDSTQETIKGSLYDNMGESMDDSADLDNNLRDEWNERDDNNVDESFWDKEIESPNNEQKSSPSKTPLSFPRKEYRVPSTSPSQSVESEAIADEKDEFIEAPLGNIDDIVQISGEYQCLGCGEVDYFLKGFLFHKCPTLGCAGPADGYHPVCMLF